MVRFVTARVKKGDKVCILLILGRSSGILEGTYVFSVKKSIQEEVMHLLLRHFSFTRVDDIL